jgi:UTP--glucose-1-phosphate uridylyltransferase
VFEPAIFDVIAGLTPGVGGELQLTDAISRLAGAGTVWGYRFEAAYHDTGTIPAYLETTLRLALADPRFGPRLRLALEALLRSSALPA